MDFIIDAINEWLTEMLISGIVSNFTNMFDKLNSEVSSIAIEVGKTPSDWDSSIYSFIRSLSESVLLPIAGLIITFVMCYELITMIIDKNNMHDFSSSDIFKWIFKTFIAVMLLSSVFDIVLAIFDVGQHVVLNSASFISEGSIDITETVETLEVELESYDVGKLLGLYLQSVIAQFSMNALTIAIFIVIYGRMMEIYMVTALAPIPFATLQNKEWGSMGQNYIKSLCALAIQAFLIMVCVGIYSVLVNNVASSVSDNPMTTIWVCLGYTALLCVTLFKTSSISKSIFNAH